MNNTTMKTNNKTKKNFKKSLVALVTLTMASQMLILPTSAAPKNATTGYATNMLQSVSKDTQTGTIQSRVNLRDTASTSGSIIRKVNQGETVTILGQAGASWYKVQDTQGNVGYLSSDSKYIKLGGTSSSSNPSINSVDNDKNNNTSASSKIENVIKTGMSYLGTPYEFGSNRNNTSTFDCSDFVRHIFKQSAGITLPSDSRKQGDWVKQNSTVKNSISQLERGDLMFFMSYKGSKASSYAGVNKSTERITHVGVYLGNGQVMHTYSEESGGVRVDNIEGKAWEHRFLYGGSVL